MGNTGKSKWAWILLSCLGVVVLVVALLPTLLLSSPGLRLLLPPLNERIGGNLTLGNCSGGWWTAIECSEVRFQEGTDKSVFHARRVATDRSLLRLIAAPHNLGVVAVEEPVFVLKTAQRRKAAAGIGDTEQKPSSPPSEGGKSTFGDSTVADQSSAIKTDKPFWEGMLAGLHLTHGKVEVPNTSVPLGTLAEEIDLQASLRDGTVTYDLHFLSGEQHGRFSAQGFFNLPIANQPILPSLVSSTDVAITRLDLSAFLQAAAAMDGGGTAIPTGAGVLDGKWQIRTAGLHDIRIKGESRVEQLALTGGALGADHPVFDQLELTVDAASNTRGEWQLNTFSLESALADIEGHGVIRDAVGEIQVNGKLYLPVLLSMFPNTLHIQPHTSFSQGELDVALSVQKTAEGSAVGLTIESGTLRGTYGNQPIIWDKPLSFSAKMQHEPDRVFFPEVRLTTDFLSLSGGGSLDNFSLAGNVDLDKGSRTVRTFVDTRYAAQGNMQFSSTSTAVPDHGYQVETSLTVDRFSLKADKAEIVPPHPLRLSLRAVAPRNWPGAAEPLRFDLNMENWLGEVDVQARDFFAPLQNKQWPRGTFTFTSTLDLDPLTGFLQQLQPPSVPFSARGALTLSGTVATQAHMLRVGEVKAEATNLDMAYQETSYQDQRISLTLSGSPSPTDPEVPVVVRPLAVFPAVDTYRVPMDEWAVFDFEHRRMDVPFIALDSGILALSATAVHAGDWRDPYSDFRLDFSSAFRVEHLMDVLHQLGRVAEHTRADGEARLKGTVTGHERQLETKVQLEGDHIGFTHKDQPILQGEQVAAQANLVQAQGSRNVELPVVAMESSLLTWKGSVAYEGDVQRILTIEGKALPDFSRLAQVAEKLIDRPLLMSGKSPQQVSLQLPLQAAAGQERRIAFTYEGVVDTFGYQGIDVRSLAVSSAIGQGKGELDIRGQLNGGLLRINPSFDGASKPPVFFLSQPQAVLSDVQLKEPLMQNVLGKVHPLFGVLVRPQGVVSMQANAFRWPAGTVEQAEFETVFDVRQLQLESNVFLREILQLLGLADEAMDLRDAEVTCHGKEGRVSCSPVHILIADSEMTMSGSVGYDGSLDYQLSVPVTRSLVGKEGYRVLEGTTIDIPIRGSVDQPLFSRDNLQDAIGQIMKQTATKAVEKQLQKMIPGLLENVFGQ